MVGVVHALGRQGHGVVVLDVARAVLVREVPQAVCDVRRAAAVEVVTDAVADRGVGRGVLDGVGVAGGLHYQRDARLGEAVHRAVVPRHALLGPVEPEHRRRRVPQFAEEGVHVVLVVEVALRASDDVHVRLGRGPPDRSEFVLRRRVESDRWHKFVKPLLP